METTHRTTRVLRCKVAILGDACVGKSALLNMFYSGGQNYPKNYVMTKIVDFCVKSIKIDSSDSASILPSTSSSASEDAEGKRKEANSSSKRGDDAEMTGSKSGPSSESDASDVATTVELYLFDCAGQSIFNQDSEPLALAHLDNTAAAIIVYDVSSRETFKNCMRWIQKIRTHLDKKSVPGVLIANKIDLVETAPGKEEEGDEEKESVRGESFVSKAEGRALAKEYGLAFFETSAKRATGVEDPFKYVAHNFKREYDEYVKAIAMMHA